MYYAFEKKNIISLIVFGAFSTTLLSIIGINSGRMTIFTLIISASLFLMALFNKELLITKIDLIGVSIISAFFIFYIGSFIYSPATSFEYGLWKLRQFIFLGFLPSISILLVGKMNNDEIEKIENFILISCIISSIVLLINFKTSGFGELNSNFFSRQTIGETNPIWLGRFLSIGLLIIQGSRFDKKPINVFIISIILLFASILTGSKTILFFTIPIVLLYKLSNGTISKKKIGNIMMIIGMFVIIIMFLDNFNNTALLSRFSLNSGTSETRLQMYKKSIESYLSGNYLNMIFGYGGGTIGSSLGYGFIRQYPHNLIIELLYESGFLGVMLFFLQIPFAIYIYLTKEKNWIFLAYILFVLFSLTSGDLTSNNFVLMFFSLYIVSQKSPRN